MCRSEHVLLSDSPHQDDEAAKLTCAGGEVEAEGGAPVAASEAVEDGGMEVPISHEAELCRCAEREDAWEVLMGCL